MPRWTRLDRLEAEATEEDALFNLHLSSEQLEFRDTLPKSGAGKLMWRTLQDEERNRQAAR